MVTLNGLPSTEESLTTPSCTPFSASTYAGAARTGCVTSATILAITMPCLPATVIITLASFSPGDFGTWSAAVSSSCPPGGMVLPAMSEMSVHLQLGCARAMVSGSVPALRSMKRAGCLVPGATTPKSTTGGSTRSGMADGACGAGEVGRAWGAAAEAWGEEVGASGAAATAGAGAPGLASVQAEAGTTASVNRMMIAFENIEFPFSTDSTHARGAHLAK